MIKRMRTLTASRHTKGHKVYWQSENVNADVICYIIEMCINYWSITSFLRSAICQTNRNASLETERGRGVEKIYPPQTGNAWKWCHWYHIVFLKIMDIKGYVPAPWEPEISWTRGGVTVSEAQSLPSPPSNNHTPRPVHMSKHMHKNHQIAAWNTNMRMRCELCDRY